MTDKRADRASPGQATAAGLGEHGPGQAAGEAPNAAADMHALIGRQLRAVFDDVAKQPVPDRFIELMKQLDQHSASG